MASRQSSVSDKTSQPGSEIGPAKGKLGVMIPGMGAVATTFVAGVEAIRKGFAQPIGSLTQMGTIRLGKRTDGRSPKINEFVPLSKIERPGLHWLGHLRRRHVLGGQQGRRAGAGTARTREAVPENHQADEGRFRSQLHPQHRWSEQEERQVEDGPGGAGA